jgi:cytosine/uracil/thiamine/allantoin permease
MTFDRIVAITSVVVAIAFGGLTIWYMRDANAVQLQQLQLEKEKAERERNEALNTTATYRKQLEDAQTKYTNILGGLIDERKGRRNLYLRRRH